MQFMRVFYICLSLNSIKLCSALVCSSRVYQVLRHQCDVERPLHLGLFSARLSTPLRSNHVCIAISTAVDMTCFLRKSMTNSSSGVKDSGMRTIISTCLLLLCLLIFLINYSKHLFDELITVVMTLTGTHFRIV